MVNVILLLVALILLVKLIDEVWEFVKEVRNGKFYDANSRIG